MPPFAQSAQDAHVCASRDRCVGDPAHRRVTLPRAGTDKALPRITAHQTEARIAARQGGEGAFGFLSLMGKLA